MVVFSMIEKKIIAWMLLSGVSGHAWGQISGSPIAAKQNQKPVEGQSKFWCFKRRQGILAERGENLVRSCVFEVKLPALRSSCVHLLLWRARFKKEKVAFQSFMGHWPAQFDVENASSWLGVA